MAGEIAPIIFDDYTFHDNRSIRVNAVDVLYAAMPAYIYLWPNLLRHLLSPLLEYQESSQYTNPYAAQDLGAYQISTLVMMHIAYPTS